MHHYSKQVDELAVLASGIPHGKKTAGWVEQFDIFDIHSRDVVSLYRLPLIDEKCEKPILPSSCYQQVGTLEICGEKINILYLSAFDGMGRREEGAKYCGKVLSLPAKAVLNEPEYWIKPTVHGCEDILRNLPEGYQPGNRIEVVEIRKPGTDSRLSMLRLPIHPICAVNKPSGGS
jgi:hypothetical protein